MKVRPAAVAGAFYPADAETLSTMVNGFLAAVPPGVASQPKAVIVPHAGYIYSGPIAASAYATIRAEGIRRVLLLGPSHFVWFPGLALPGAEFFRTPLGDIPIVSESDYPIVPAAHAREHSLEVQLPFLQMVLGPFELMPLAVGEAPIEEVADALERHGTPADTLIVVSSDLSHYLSYEEACRIDERTAGLIEHRRGEDVPREAACGLRGIQGLLVFAERHDLDVRRLDLRNSGDTQGDRSRVVGYGAFWVG